MNVALTELDRSLIDHYQRALPVSSRPYLEMANTLGVSEDEVIESLDRLQTSGVLSRVGPVFNHKKAGASVLAAIAVPEEHLKTVAEQVNAFDGVNHNYAREHEFNLWFVVTAPDKDALNQTLADIEQSCGYDVMPLPMLKSYYIDLGFKVDWDA